MFQQFVVINEFTHVLDCYCPYCQELNHFEFQKGDIIELTEEQKFLPEMGTYILVQVNKEYRFFIALEDLDYYYKKENICSTGDLQLKENYLRFKIDEALDCGDKESFHFYVYQFNEIQEFLRTVLQKNSILLQNV
ncbi:IDEAL domain-containing protein [Bacillus sp. FJAT-47783]|uniref:IDEAL domain-containing protein n=1 Tax=Bacillus sp. FJAT-47783 TaxID=2922712 RepID=UPI001FAB9EC5|nr:IDEAL domain-containing protein [Bacillus sp. FJAT-47783]